MDAHIRHTVISNDGINSEGSHKVRSLKEQLSVILNLTESMLVAAKNEEWEQLIEIGSERYQYLAQFSVFSSTPADAPWVRQGLERVLEIDKHIVQMSEKRKNTLAETNKNLSKGQAASKAYSQANSQR